MKKIIITTQKELDELDENVSAEIHITGNLDSITKKYPNAEVYVSGNAQIRNVYRNAQISYVSGNAQIRNVSGNAQIRNVYWNAQISYVSENAQISYVYGNASVLHIAAPASVETFGQNIISYEKGKKPKITASKNTTIVVLNPFDATLKAYLETYPVKQEGKNLILYKAVHKTREGKYTADYDKDFEYKVGETYKHECDPSKEKSCSPGLHVSHLYWAVNFGCGWSDMEILEVSVPKNKVVVSKDCDGKIRTSELTVLREVPKSEYQ